MGGDVGYDVWTCESGVPEYLGVYLRVVECAVEYVRSDGVVTWAPEDCVYLVADGGVCGVVVEG